MKLTRSLLGMVGGAMAALGGAVGLGRQKGQGPPPTIKIDAGGFGQPKGRPEKMRIPNMSSVGSFPMGLEGGGTRSGIPWNGRTSGVPAARRDKRRRRNIEKRKSSRS